MSLTSARVIVPFSRIVATMRRPSRVGTGLEHYAVAHVHHEAIPR
jgi:hypothetical protein